jgi:hypothetical protein
MAISEIAAQVPKRHAPPTPLFNGKPDERMASRHCVGASAAAGSTTIFPVMCGCSEQK